MYVCIHSKPQAVVKETLRTVMGTMTWRVLESAWLWRLGVWSCGACVPKSCLPLFLFTLALALSTTEHHLISCKTHTITTTARAEFGVIRGGDGEIACILPPDTSVIVPMVAIHRQVQHERGAVAFCVVLPRRQLRSGAR